MIPRSTLSPVAFLFLLAAGTGVTPAQEAKATRPTAAAADPRAADRKAVHEAMAAFSKAFAARDAKAIAALWSAEGEYLGDEGQVVRGREAIEKGFAAIFAASPEISSETRKVELRFLARDVAIAEGEVRVRRGPAESPTRAHFTAQLVREDGRWLLAQLAEDPADAPSIEELAWLIGEWRSASDDKAEIRTTYEWTPNKKFIRVRFTVKEPDLELTGDQVIGIDPATTMIRSWTFEADGGIAEGDWNPEGNHWVVDTSGTLADGLDLTETNILRRVDDDTFTWQSIDRMLGEQELPDLPPVKVTRVKAAK